MPNPGSQRVERPYKVPKRRSKSAGIPRGAHAAGPGKVIGGALLNTRTKLAPFVGRKLSGGGAKPLPKRNRVLPVTPNAPTTQPKGFAEPRSHQYVAAKRRTRAKAR